MIITKHDISLEIDGVEYKIVVAEPTKEQKEELNKFLNQSNDEREKLDDLHSKLTEYKNDFEINKTILEHGSIKEKASVWLEQKSLNKQITKTTKELNEIKKILTPLDEVMEEGFKKRFDFIVSGEGKVELKKQIEDNGGLSYLSIIMVIGEEIKKSKEKK
ncbi:MAG: hypothetical protein WA916_08975 [Arcobacter sp.]|uniref:hypothetical protein n=1 Tax=Arcobacter sp. TaxID=1872629 RepID=UPI003C717C1B